MLSYITQNQILCSKKYLLAISGGVDSMVLLDVFKKSKLSFSIAHCNFNLRIPDADLDETMIKNYAEKNNITLYTTKFETKHFAEEKKISIQEAARELRYTYFFELLKIHNLDYLVTAHHQNDNTETMLFRFCRGTGISGLKGIPMHTDKIIRPFLHIPKEKIIAYASENNIHFREDSSNQKDNYTRNYLRNKIIPLLEEKIPTLHQNITDNTKRLSDVACIYNNAIAEYKKKLLEKKGDDIYISIKKLKKIKPLHTILFEILTPFNFTFEQTNKVIELFTLQGGNKIESETHRVFFYDKFLIITPTASQQKINYYIENNQNKIETKHFTIEIKKINPHEINISNLPYMEYFDASKIKFPLLLRIWKQGDYFYPLGMRKKKKVSRFLIDNKIPQPNKEKIWILESNQKIVWVVGLRMDERFKITPHTKEIYCITQHHNE